MSRRNGGNYLRSAGSGARLGNDLGSPFFCLLFFGEAKKSEACGRQIYLENLMPRNHLIRYTIKRCIIESFYAHKIRNGLNFLKRLSRVHPIYSRHQCLNLFDRFRHIFRQHIITIFCNRHIIFNTNPNTAPFFRYAFVIRSYINSWFNG